MPSTARALLLCLPLLLVACGGTAGPAGGSQTVVLMVSGMDCEGCASSVRHALSAVDGVELVEIDLEGERASVVCSAATDPKRLVQVVDAEPKFSAFLLPR